MKALKEAHSLQMARPLCRVCDFDELYSTINLASYKQWSSKMVDGHICAYCKVASKLFWTTQYKVVHEGRKDLIPALFYYRREYAKRVGTAGGLFL